ncbi:AIPR family protein [Pontibacter vulgaris]|uniref:AIPR family protein n=1 Tax=Pontibacter vulgaris TaxID=2905679 RepID=UPI001FA6FA1C|nr:AIPR family protein [Pontibacter vulgaris]
MELEATLNTISYEDFKTEWLKDIISGNPSTTELGHRFSRKLLGDWLDFNAETEDIIFCDGAGDGGIDVAFLVLGDILEDGNQQGNTWYIVQSKHGSAFSGPSTILIEGQKVIDNLRGHNTNLSSVGESLSTRLRNFILNAGPNDQLRLVYATHEPLSEQEKRAAEDIRTLGRTHLGDLFDVESISIQTIFNRLTELQSDVNKTQVSLNARLVESGDDLYVGSVTLLDLFKFLKAYKNATGDLDQLYEKNVRKYLGGGRVVNKGIANTLKSSPEKFGLFNNGITIVAEDVEAKNDLYLIREPYIVNGCQTTKTIWQVLLERLDVGSSTLSAETEHWRDRLTRGIVIVKLVKVGKDGEAQLIDITRFTNSQNSVSRQDFISLEGNFRALATSMSRDYNIYLEIHRGGWESQKMLQKQNLNGIKYSEYVNAFDMLKIYGAAWMSEPGIAFGKNPPFAPGGTIFKRIMDSNSFGSEEVYACYLLQKLANKIKFGRGAEKPSRGQTRYLFYYVLVDLIKDILINANKPYGLKDITAAVNKIYKSESEASNGLTAIALNVIDNYLADGSNDSLFTEPEYNRTKDFNNFLKWDKLGKGREYTPKFEQLLFSNKFLLGQSLAGQKSVRNQIIEML